MTSVVEQHRANAPRSVRVAVLTVSDTRTEATDTSGALILALVKAAGHVVVDRQIVADDRTAISRWLSACEARGDVEAAILTGGTGLSGRDVTPEAIEPRFTKSIPGFGELFRSLSLAEIGSATIMSRACAGMVERMVLFALPGSRAGVELAMTRIIIPELPHLVQQAQKS